MEATEYKAGVKAYLRMPAEVSVYDKQIDGLIASAIQTLKIAGITSDSALTHEYVNTYVRLNMMQDAEASFVSSEKSRLAELISTIYYSGEGEV